MTYPPPGQGPMGQGPTGPDDWQPYGSDPNQQSYWDPYAQQAPGYQQPGYQQPGYQQPIYPQQYPGGYGYPGYYQPPSNSGKAIMALVCGIVSILGSFLCCAIALPAAVAAVVLGILARREISESAGYERGAGMALAGIITGAIGAALCVAWILFALVFSVIDTGTY